MILVLEGWRSLSMASFSRAEAMSTNVSSRGKQKSEETDLHGSTYFIFITKHSESGLVKVVGSRTGWNRLFRPFAIKRRSLS